MNRVFLPKKELLSIDELERPATGFVDTEISVSDEGPDPLIKQWL